MLCRMVETNAILVGFVCPLCPREEPSLAIETLSFGVLQPTAFIGELGATEPRTELADTSSMGVERGDGRVHATGYGPCRHRCETSVTPARSFSAEPPEKRVGPVLALPPRMRLGILLLLTSFTAVASAQDVVIVIETVDQLSTPPPTQLEAPVIEVPEAPAPSLQAPQQYVPSTQLVPQQPQMQNTDALRLDQLRRSRPSIGGPVSMMAAGFVTGVMSAWMAMLFNDLDDWGCSSCGPSEDVIGLSVLSAAAFSLAIVGVITLFRRVAKRRRITREIRELQVAF